MKKEDIQNLISQMTLEEKAGLCSGADFWHLKGVERLGIPSVMVTDGPHGLRKQSEQADHLGINESVKAVCFPTGCATASSFDRNLLRKLGETIGQECQAENVSTILGPAMNIKRSPLCGRNFEYYSEDPLISGKMAAAMTRGVQKNRGCFVTIKHFCCNNQEDNRNRTNANVSERALREIYLRGFEIVVKEAYPGAVMSSYNKVNGEYVNNSYDLLTKVLRNEWGFDGLVMTDWFATGKGLGDHAKAIAAGNDLLMPGGDGAVKAVTKAVQDGVITVTDVRRCAANVLHGIMSSRIYYAFCKKNGTLLR